MVEDVLLLGRTVVDDVLFLFRQVAEGHVGAHAHRAADIRHQGPHQAVPRGDRALVDGQGVVRHQCIEETIDPELTIDRADDAGAAAGLARAL